MSRAAQSQQTQNIPDGITDVMEDQFGLPRPGQSLELQAHAQRGHGHGVDLRKVQIQLSDTSSVGPHRRSDGSRQPRRFSIPETRSIGPDNQNAMSQLASGVQIHRCRHLQYSLPSHGAGRGSKPRAGKASGPGGPKLHRGFPRIDRNPPNSWSSPSESEHSHSISHSRPVGCLSTCFRSFLPVNGV